MAPNTPSEIAVLADPLALLNLNNLASLKDGAYIHSLQQVKGNFSTFESEERIINEELKLQPRRDSTIETNSYWDWPSEDPLGVVTIEKRLVSDSNSRKVKNRNEIESTEANDEQYWDWNASTEPKVEDIVANLMEYERIRPTFSICNVEKMLKPVQSEHSQRSSKNVVLSESSDYWHFSTDDSVEHDVAEVDFKKNQKIVEILSVDYILSKLEKCNANSVRTNEDESAESANYWSWPAAEKIENDYPIAATPAKAEISVTSSSIDTDLDEILRNNSNDEILNWILESRELGLIPSSQVFSQLLDSFRPRNEADSTENYWEERPERLAHFGNEHYWDEIPASACYEKPICHGNEVEVGYWDEKLSNDLTEEEIQECYWDM